MAKHLSPLSDDDDDDSHGQAQSFYTLNQFNSKCANMFSSHNVCKIFSSVHFYNCRSLHKNCDNMQCTLDTLDIQFSVIGVTETWLRESDPLYNIQNYTFLANGRKTKRGGGVGLYSAYQNKGKPYSKAHCSKVNKFENLHVAYR